MRSLMPMFDNGFLNDTGFWDDSREFAFVPKVDVKELSDSYEVVFDLPGMKKDDLSISYSDDVLTVEAKSEKSSDEKEGDVYLRRERFSSSFKRQFVIRGVDEKAVKASLKDGVLRITLPKIKENANGSVRRIQID